MTQERKVVSESRETTFDVDIASLDELEAVLAELVAKLCDGLATQERRGRTIGIKVRLDDFSTHTRARTLAEPVGSARSGRPGRAGAAAAVRAAPAGPAARRARRRPGGRRSPPTPSSSRSRSERGAQYSAAASRRRESRASGLSTPSSSRMPTTTRRMSSLAPSASGSAPISRSSARSWSPASSAAKASVRSGCSGVGLAALEPDPGGQPVGGEAAGHLAQERQRPVGVAAGEQQPRQRHGRVGAGGLQLDGPAQ